MQAMKTNLLILLSLVRHGPRTAMKTFSRVPAQCRQAKYARTCRFALRSLVCGAAPLLASLSLAASLAPPAFQWTETDDLNKQRSRHTATLLPDGNVLVTGGLVGGFVNYITASCELYDPASATWSRTDDLSHERQYHTATLLPDDRC
jgi:hypothetical protein